MSAIVIIVSGIVAMFVALIGLETYSRYKLKRKVIDNWGKQPYQSHLDKEESLNQAWQIEKGFRHWDSEVDELTWHDLDMFEIFKLINGTYSSVGSEALYQQLRNFNFAKDQELEDLIDFFEENPKMQQEIQYNYARLGKQDNNFTKQYLASGQREQLGTFWLYVALGVLPIISLLLLLIIGPAALLLFIGAMVFNIIFYMYKKVRLEIELNSMRYLVQTIVLTKKLCKLKTPLQAEMKQNFQPLKGIAMWGFSFRIKGNTEADVLFDYLNMMFMIPFIAYNFVLTRLSKYNQQAINLWEALGKMEVAIAVLNFRIYVPLSCQPQLKTGGVVAENIYHPLVNGPVANPVEWQKNILVTGSNASGKSTYVRSIAISAILAQTINTALAESFTIQAGHVITSMAVEDNVIEGDSYFVAEIKSIKRLLDQVATSQRCYCFVDEILKGTNTIERIAASSSVVNWISAYPSLAFVATHDIELTEILKTKCDNLHFEEQVTEEQGVNFDYQVRQGPATTRNAIALLKVLGYPETLVKQAQSEAEYFDKHRTWTVFE